MDVQDMIRAGLIAAVFLIMIVVFRVGHRLDDNYEKMKEVERERNHVLIVTMCLAAVLLGIIMHGVG